MDEVGKQQDHNETLLKVSDDKKRKWNSFKKGKKQIKKLWKSRKNTKQAEGEQSSQGDSDDSRENMAYDSANERLPMSPVSTSSIDPVPSISLHRPSVASSSARSSPDYMAPTTEEDEPFSNTKESTRPKSPPRGSLALIEESNVCDHDNYCLLGA